MWTLSGFADEIDDDPETQCRVLAELGVGAIEVRSAWGVNVLDLVARALSAPYIRLFSFFLPAGDDPARCLDLVESVGSDRLRLAWDPANFVQCGVRPYRDGYALLRPHVEYIQIKDALRGATRYDGRSGADLFGLAHAAFTGMLRRAGLPYA